ncbi:MAG: RCC1 domain-containing protein [Spirochaetota bacterium]
MHRFVLSLTLIASLPHCKSFSGSNEQRTARKVISIAAAEAVTCAVFENGKAACVGKTGSLTGHSGIFADSSTASAAPELPLPFAISSLAIAQNQRGMHGCALSKDGRVFCWGDNPRGQAGPPAESQALAELAAKSGIPLKKLARLRPVSLAAELMLPEKAAAVVTGYAHSCALTVSGSVFCWGDNIFYQLGQERFPGKALIEQSSTPIPVSVVTRDEAARGLRAMQLAAGSNHTCALLSDGFVRCWGDNGFGQLGHIAIARNDGDADAAARVGVAPSQKGNLPLLSAAEQAQGLRAQFVAAAGDRSCAAFSNGRVRCWGENRWQKLGYTNEKYPKVSLVKPPAEMGDIPLAGDIAAIVMSQVHSCALARSGAVYCWGSNANGQLGDPAISSTENDGQMPPKAVPLLRASEVDTVVSLAAGAGHTCALLQTGKVRCWGQGFDGQLGTGFAKKFGKKECMNFTAYCLGDEADELPPPDVSW